MAQLPFLRDISRYTSAKHIIGSLSDFFQKTVKDHQQSLEPANTRDFIDVYLKQIASESNTASSFFGEKGQDYLLNILLDFFLAGMETTSSSLLWAILYMIHFPEKQQRVQKELDEVVGRDRLPSLEDKEQLPYLNAVLHESFRLSGLAYMSVPHRAVQDVDLAGYRIPKDTVVLSNLFSIMRDPKHWTHPDEFLPERFINEEDGSFQPSEKVVPFGVGKRYCLGQSLAEKEYFLFFAGMMQKFNFEVFPGTELPGFGIENTHPEGPTRNAPSYNMKLTLRC